MVAHQLSEVAAPGALAEHGLALLGDAAPERRERLLHVRDLYASLERALSGAFSALGSTGRQHREALRLTFERLSGLPPGSKIASELRASQECGIGIVERVRS